MHRSMRRYARKEGGRTRPKRTRACVLPDRQLPRHEVFQCLDLTRYGHFVTRRCVRSEVQNPMLAPYTNDSPSCLYSVPLLRPRHLLMSTGPRQRAHDPSPSSDYSPHSLAVRAYSPARGPVRPRVVGEGRYYCSVWVAAVVGTSCQRPSAGRIRPYCGLCGVVVVL